MEMPEAPVWGLRAGERLAKEAAGKLQRAKLCEPEIAGAQARMYLCILLARLKPCPCYKAPRAEFSAACKAQVE